jgi:hypothetical protein
MTSTEVLSVHLFRRAARKRERELQAWLDSGRLGVEPGHNEPAYRPVPSWAEGVRVDPAGVFQHAVVATVERGH